MAKKAATKQEKIHLNAVAELGCIACAKLGWHGSPAEIHHIKAKGITGMGLRASHFHAIPLCPSHHRHGEYAYHHSPENFTYTFGTQEELLKEVQDWLARDGCPCGCIKKTGGESPNPFDMSNLFYE